MSRSSARAAALLPVLVLTACGVSDGDPTPTPSPSADAAALLEEVECASGLTDGIPRASEVVVLAEGTPLLGEGPAEPLPDFDVEEVAREPLPGSAIAIAAVQCTAVYVVGEGYAGFALRAYDDPARLTATLRTAHPPAPSEDTCTDILDVPPNLWVVTQDGELLAPAWPADGCGHYTRPRPESMLTEPELAPIDLEALAPFEG